MLLSARTPGLQNLPTCRDEQGTAILARKFRIMCASINAGIFPSAQPDHWCCGPRFCGYSFACPRIISGKLVSLGNVVTRLSGILFGGIIRLSLTASGEHMSMMACGRRDISDSIREKPESRLPGREGSRGGRAHDNRRFVNVVFRVMRTGAPWRDPPADFGGWSDTRRRFIRWHDNGVWERPPEIPIAGFTLMRRAREEATGT